MPKRIQRQRTKGWTMPAGAVYVGRPTKWGNPFRGSTAVDSYLVHCAPGLRAMAKRELRGKDLACWCSLDKPCHADVLLALANDEHRKDK